MDKKRAQEIIESEEMIKVTHEGEPVYLNAVDEENEMAHIQPFGNVGREQLVALHSLLEEESEQQR
ncbi:H-type small acid-soluble spore protein [Thalassobacillus hwangdonensis]|uniref:Small, acid-soluble spore protein H n=1 Tax=Thalassobacillus hwangdonensis TaxID=546108 RepID=A0ABW3L1H6_9BACI